MQLIIISAILGAALVALGFFIGRRSKTLDLKHTIEEYSWYREHYLQRNGCMVGYGSYLLMSFDRGRNWYAVDRSSEKGVVILGTAEEKFPGLLKNLKMFDDLTSHVKKNGPLSLGNESDLVKLENMGFTIERGKSSESKN
ncbi:MAG: hypothetical protein JWM20_915 [Patescibacteria group bacterium]|nr:hypothetical protein [Patescibacteria group bacterium]